MPQLYVSGRIQYGEVEGQEGRRRTTTIVAEEILFLSPRGGGSRGSEGVQGGG